MKKDEIKKIIVRQFEFWKEEIEKMDTKKVSPRDFDSWLAGYISGLTSNGVNKEFIENIKEITDYVVNSEIVKSCGVTGTEKEKFKIIKI